ncbi:MAG: HypC/HybG/HupF family hydrogenase formation chaperone [Candidatus Omnitrophica bacterium]|nr:HypC/HybG/HupF family hydrogenase formation chaperone [Candidatus Omnitrophota bacterium]
MCWSVPGKILEVRNDNTAVIELSGIKRPVSTDLIDDPAPGEYVLVHAGYAIQKVDEERAKFTLDFFKKGGRDA